MKLCIQAFRAILATNKGRYGATALFDRGLNVIRAENTSGKSSLINGILYALGLEILVGKRGKESIKPVLHSGGDFGGVKFKVLESFVELEITNSKGVVITIRRHIVGDKDERLVEVFHGPVVTGEPPGQYRVESFFVGIEGAAQRDKGFHHFLAEFLELDLPSVSRFKGDNVPLYMECVAPLMFIEQIRGWSGIQATLRHGYGIRNVGRLAVEYILNLDVIKNANLRIQVTEEANHIREEWGVVRESMSSIASQVGGWLVGVPDGPVALLPDAPWLAISNGENVITIDDYIVANRSLLIEIFGRKESEKPGVVNRAELEAKLGEQETELLVVQAEASQLRSDVQSERNEIQRLRSRLDFVKADIRRNKDVKRLRDFGVNKGLSLIQDRCPTCNQTIQDTLIPTGATVMGVEENIKFLSTEIEAITLLISAGEKRLERLQGEEARKSKELADLRLTIRDLRSELIQSGDFPIAELRAQIHLEEEVSRVEKLRDQFEALSERLTVTVERWRQNRIKYSDLPQDYFSSEDKKKLDALSGCFSQNVRQFGYRSTGISRLHISEENYRPICDEFEIAFGASASDNIRLIWAYTLALLQVSLDHQCNHWGIVIFDEPEQQQMREASSDALYLKISEIEPKDFQIIVATSASIEVTNRRLKKFPANLVEFGEKVIRPLGH
jgi:hypothetical protein